jgi:CubicO group peptidase (beta-lactamase class C family)
MSDRSLWSRLASSVACCLLLAAQAEPLDDYVRDQMRKTRLPGVALVVSKAGALQKMEPYGLANIDLNLATTLNSVYPLASATKVFTATAVLMLVEEGKLFLDDRISALLPGLPAAWKDVIVLHCLTHTSGVPDLDDENGTPIADTQEDALKKIVTMPLVFTPGEKSSYNQTGFLILKMIIEKKSGMKFEDFLAKRFFEPLKMTSARFGDSRDLIPNRVVLYHRWVRDSSGRRVVSPDRLSHDSTSYPSYWYGGVGLNLSATDFARFDTALIQGRLLRAATLKQMWTPYKLAGGDSGEFAAGWQTSVLNGHRVVYIVGAGRVCYAHLVDDGYSVIWMANGRGGADVRDFVWDVLNRYVPGIVKKDSNVGGGQ